MYACRVHYVHTVLQAVILIFCCMVVVPTPFKRTNKDKYTLKYDKKIIYLQNRTVAVITQEKKYNIIYNINTLTPTSNKSTYSIHTNTQ